MKMRVKATLIPITVLLFLCLLARSAKSEGIALVTLPGDYYSINDAVNAIAEGGRISVLNGTWYEYVRVHKPVALISLNSSRFGVIIDGKYHNYPGAPYLIDVQADNVTIVGFTFLTSDSHIGIGIHAENCKNLVIANCTFMDSTDIGIFLVNVSNITLFNNYVESYCYPLLLHECNNMTITYNTFKGYQAINIYNSRDLIFHHNNVMPRAIYPYSYVVNTTCTWNNGHNNGNYWSNYKTRYPNATELASGIWDTPYQIDPDNIHIDQYPLVNDPELPSSLKLLLRGFKHDWCILLY